MAVAFSFAGFTAKVVGVSVESPKAELADMTSMYNGIGQMVVVPTGDWSGGSIAIDYIANAGAVATSLVRARDILLLSAPNMSVSFNAICESVSAESKVGDVFRGSLKFVLTDYYG